MTIIPPTSKSPPSFAVIATLLRSGETAIFPRDWPGFKMLRDQVGRGGFPPSQRLDVISLASSTTSEHEQTQTRWALDDLATATWPPR